MSLKTNTRLRLPVARVAEGALLRPSLCPSPSPPRLSRLRVTGRLRLLPHCQAAIVIVEAKNSGFARTELM